MLACYSLRGCSLIVQFIFLFIDGKTAFGAGSFGCFKQARYQAWTWEIPHGSICDITFESIERAVIGSKLLIKTEIFGDTEPG